MPKLCVIPGDGIGREVIPAAVCVLRRLIPGLELIEAEAGWDCFIQHGVSVPQATLDAVKECGAALFGAVSSPSNRVDGYRSAILTLRRSLDLYANVRPVRSLPPLSPRPDVDLILVRENTEGLYAGRERSDGETAIAERVITRQASRRIARLALDLARAAGRRKLTIVHKANVLPVTDGLFRESVREVASDFARAGFTIELDELLVDTAALKMVAEPQRFDMIVTTNLFGDILSDVASYWCGGIGLAPSLNLGDEIVIAEPVHGSAPDIAGRGLANPIAAILSAALLVRHSWGLPETAQAIERAVAAALQHGIPEPNTRSILESIIQHLET